MSIDITEIVVALIGLAATVITTVLVPFIKKKLDAESYNQLINWTKTAVSAAEIIYTGAGRGEEKKQYVLEFLKSKGLNVDEESLDNCIESAVLELKNSVEE